MVNKLKFIIPKRVLSFLRTMKKSVILFSNLCYDYRRMLRYSSYLSDNSELKLEAKIIETYHVLEKGLGMVNRKPGFGKEKVNILINLLNRYVNSGYSLDNSQIQSAVVVLAKYFQCHNNLDDATVNNLRLKANSLFETVTVNSQISGGTISVTRENILKMSKGDFKELAFSRFSIRNFNSGAVDITKVKEAISIAQKTPSACNRQSSRVYIIKNNDIIYKILSLQNGNRGFGHLIDKLLIVTSDLNAFKGANERNQSFIDGGMYAMSLLYALHYVGLGACPLNWSVVKGKDKALREIVDVKDSENILMIIGIGNLPKKFYVGMSQRKSIEEVTKII